MTDLDGWIIDDLIDEDWVGMAAKANSDGKALFVRNDPLVGIAAVELRLRWPEFWKLVVDGKAVVYERMKCCVCKDGNETSAVFYVEVANAS